MTDELLNEYDIISARYDYLTGCFALYRNNPFMRELFKQSRDNRKVLPIPVIFSSMKPISAATVFITNTTIGTTTNLKRYYRLQIPG